MQNHALFVLIMLGSLISVACSDSFSESRRADKNNPAIVQVTVTGGALEGMKDGDIDVFKGIRYAQPPVVDNRWRAPQPLSAWDGVRDATAFGSDCMQKPFPGDAAPLATKPAEDCLYLNVWVPANATGNTPVAVWIHGGGLVNGGSSPPTYSGHAFANAGVLFVSINYRLGRFGFFAHPALTAASEGPLGNYGFLDQIAALEWVQQNIAAFGGDPDQVTLIGESAGGRSVHALMQTPLADGLFHRSVIMSGGGRGLMTSRPLSDDSAGQPSAEQVGVNFARQHGIEGSNASALTALRKLPADAVLNGYNLTSMFSPQSGPPTFSGAILDGQLVVGQTEQRLQDGQFATMPVMVGTTSADLGMMLYTNKTALFQSFGEAEEAAVEAYDPYGTRPFEAVAADVGQDRAMQEPARFVAQQVTRQGAPVYLYRFGYVAQSQANGTGAAHASEIPFFFNTADIKYPQATEQDLTAATQAFSYLVSFIRNGKPDSSALPVWPAYTDDTHTIMLFRPDGSSLAAPDPWTRRLDAVQHASVQSEH